mmetsp:Transcript_3880/g.13623  ORF Transcript_3880/g.13623 Transcript_3880/m.13623 type:complete len:201 (-) Transcript_3880:1286-1888(-)
MGRASLLWHPMRSSGTGRGWRRCCWSSRRGWRSRCRCCWRSASPSAQSTRPSRVATPTLCTTPCSTSNRGSRCRTSWSWSTTARRRARCSSPTARRLSRTRSRRCSSPWEGTRTSRRPRLRRFFRRQVTRTLPRTRPSSPPSSAACRGPPICTRSPRSTPSRAGPAWSTLSCSSRRGSWRTLRRIRGTPALALPSPCPSA